jgi:hypothetical protein
MEARGHLGSAISKCRTGGLGKLVDSLLKWGKAFEGDEDVCSRAGGCESDRGMSPSSPLLNQWLIKTSYTHGAGYAFPFLFGPITLTTPAQQKEIVAYCKEHNIAIEAYSPLAQGKYADNPVLVGVAKEAGKTWAQVLIRWSLQHG